MLTHQSHLDDVILQVFEENEDDVAFYFPVSTQKQARSFVKALHAKGISYQMICDEIIEFEQNFTSWRTGLGRPGIGNRVIERINRPVQEILLCDLDEDEDHGILLDDTVKAQDEIKPTQTDDISQQQQQQQQRDNNTTQSVSFDDVTVVNDVETSTTATTAAITMTSSPVSDHCSLFDVTAADNNGKYNSNNIECVEESVNKDNNKQVDINICDVKTTEIEKQVINLSATEVQSVDITPLQQPTDVTGELIQLGDAEVSVGDETSSGDVKAVADDMLIDQSKNSIQSTRSTHDTSPVSATMTIVTMETTTMNSNDSLLELEVSHSTSHSETESTPNGNDSLLTTSAMTVDENYNSDNEIDGASLDTGVNGKQLLHSKATDGPGYIYIFTDTPVGCNGEYRVKVGASRYPCSRLRQAVLFNIDIRLVSAVSVSARRTAAQAVRNQLGKVALGDTVDWFRAPLDMVLDAFMIASRQFPVITTDSDC